MLIGELLFWMNCLGRRTFLALPVLASEHVSYLPAYREGVEKASKTLSTLQERFSRVAGSAFRLTPMVT
jgi:hypothetical protein